MRILCPHCNNPIELVKLTPREEINCPSCGSSFHLDTDATTGWERQAGQKLGKFELIDIVGVGAFGTVYKARDPELDRVVLRALEERGYPTGRDAEERTAHLAVDHPDVVERYRHGRAMLGEVEGASGTENLRKAMLDFRAVFEEIVEPERTVA